MLQLLRFVSRALAIFQSRTKDHFDLVSTMCVDGYFWKQERLWPELVGVLFNVYEGKSADWGVRILFSHTLGSFEHRVGLPSTCLFFRTASQVVTGGRSAKRNRIPYGR